MLLGDKIRSLRKSKQITQAQLAEALSVSSQSVQKIVLGVKTRVKEQHHKEHQQYRDDRLLTDDKPHRLCAESRFVHRISDHMLHLTSLCVCRARWR